jgi:hypothetical protein
MSVSIFSSFANLRALAAVTRDANCKALETLGLKSQSSAANRG